MDSVLNRATFAGCLTIGMVACAPVVSETIDTADGNLSLSSENGNCVLTHSSATDGVETVYELVPESPCFFAKDRDGTTDERSFYDHGVESLYLVIGGALDAKTRSLWDLSSERPCGNTVQAVLISNGQVRVSPTSLAEGVWCADRHIDQKVFEGFALREKK